MSRRISRRDGADNYVCLWTFGTHQEALDAMQAWLDEQPKPSQWDLFRAGVPLGTL